MNRHESAGYAEMRTRTDDVSSNPEVMNAVRSSPTLEIAVGQSQRIVLDVPPVPVTLTTTDPGTIPTQCEKPPAKPELVVRRLDKSKVNTMMRRLETTWWAWIQKEWATRSLTTCTERKGHRSFMAYIGGNKLRKER